MYDLSLVARACAIRVIWGIFKFPRYHMKLEDMVQDIRDIQDGSGQVATELNTQHEKTQPSK